MSIKHLSYRVIFHQSFFLPLNGFYQKLDGFGVSSWGTRCRHIMVNTTSPGKQVLTSIQKVLYKNEDCLSMLRMDLFSNGTMIAPRIPSMHARDTGHKLSTPSPVPQANRFREYFILSVKRGGVKSLPGEENMHIHDLPSPTLSWMGKF